MNILKKIYGKFYRYHRLNKLLSLEKKYLKLYNGSFDTECDASKMENQIRISVHGIEKGFSYRDTKPAFGKEKILNLLRMLSVYIKLEGHKEIFVLDSLSTVKYYLDTFHGNETINEIQDAFNIFVSKYSPQISAKPTTLTIKKSDVDYILNSIDYESFVSSRHSYRFYANTPVDPNLIYKALKIAEHTPTACNRQAQHVYVFRGENKEKLLNISPSRGFVNEIDVAILITVDMRAYFGDEFYQCYVDGGLYAMNLINAIHSTGLGCIPLTAGMFAVNQREELSKRFNIPLNEAPIITIGVGNRENSAKVNASYRKSYTEYTIIDYNG